MTKGGAARTSPSAASRVRAATATASLRGLGRGRGARDLLVPLLVHVARELGAETEAVRLGDVGVLLLDVAGHVLDVEAGVAVELVDDDLLRLGREQPVHERERLGFVLAVG